MLFWTPNSIQQLEGIAHYIALDSPHQSQRVATMIVRATQRLKTFPESGAVAPELDDVSVREIRVFSFRILYPWHTVL